MATRPQRKVVRFVVMISTCLLVHVVHFVNAVDAARRAPGGADDARRAKFVPAVRGSPVVRKEIAFAQGGTVVSHAAR